MFRNHCVDLILCVLYITNYNTRLLVSDTNKGILMLNFACLISRATLISKVLLRQYSCLSKANICISASIIVQGYIKIVEFYFL